MLISADNMYRMQASAVALVLACLAGAALASSPSSLASVLAVYRAKASATSPLGSISVGPTTVAWLAGICLLSFVLAMLRPQPPSPMERLLKKTQAENARLRQQLAEQRLITREAQNESAKLQQQNRRLMDELNALRLSLFTQLGLSEAHQSELAPIEAIIREPAVREALAAAPSNKAQAVAAASAIAAHLQANPHLTSAVLSMPCFTRGEPAAALGSGWVQRDKKLDSAVALTLVTLRNAEWRRTVSTELGPRLTPAAQAGAASWQRLHAQLHNSKRWSHADRASQGALRDVLWFAMGDDPSDRDLFPVTKIERVAAALFVGLLAKEGMLV